MRVALTGADGFLGWHVRVLVKALGWPEPVLLTRSEMRDADAVAVRLEGIDRVLHLAGVNRGEPAEVSSGNVDAAAALAEGLRRCLAPPGTVVYANSIQAGNGTPYGDSKAMAAALLAEACDDLRDVRLTNLYGEHGRPHYNSVVATFCRILAEQGRPEIHEDRQLSLVHVTDAAAHLLDAPTSGSWDGRMPELRIGLRDLADRLATFAAIYRTGEIPPLPDRHAVRLFNTYRSHCFPAHYPMPLSRRSDARGELVETVKAHGSAGQTFCSTSHPGVVRGEHFHLAKVERFCVLSGSGEICLRRVGHRDVVRFPVSGDEPVVVDMPTMWVHNIVNVGAGELLTLFWTNELFDPASPDTYAEPVEAGSLVPAMAVS
ncbi:polysaccharide biosynthesis C-terminal domain-containing protein [Micromonospora sp. URMC 103]|uniref:polysaccharide biosynthesis C-terminal domain-containing protein n=1 Tax=Micromonospora sp. URMC 103 TaxID=3423406 RepID=UPI003F1AC716